MDNFRRRSFLTKDLITNAIGFNNTNELYQKRITKLYIPMLPYKSGTVTLFNQNWLNTSLLGARNASGASVSTAKTIYYDNELVGSTSSAGAFRVGTDNMSTYEYIKFYIGSTAFFTIQFFPLTIFKNGQHYSYTIDSIKKFLKGFIGVDDIPYMCIDFTKFMFGSQSVAYMEAVNNIDSGDIVNSSFSSQYPLYYEEYTG